MAVEVETRADAMEARVERLEDYRNARLAEWNFLLGKGARIVAGPESEPWISRCIDRVIPCRPASGNDLLQFVRELGFEVAEDH